MKDKEIVIRMKSCGLDELSEQDRHLVECAKNCLISTSPSPRDISGARMAGGG